MTGTDERALDSLSIAPDDDGAVGSGHDPRQQAGQDKSIAKRMKRTRKARMRGWTMRWTNRWTPAIRRR